MYDYSEDAHHGQSEGGHYGSDIAARLDYSARAYGEMLDRARTGHDRPGTIYGRTHR